MEELWRLKRVHYNSELDSPENGRIRGRSRGRIHCRKLLAQAAFSNGTSLT